MLMRRPGRVGALDGGWMRVLLADDQMAVRSALRLLLEHEAGVRVTVEAGDAQSVLTLLSEGCVDVMFLDGELPGGSMECLLPKVRKTCPQLKVIVLSGRPEAYPIAQAAGADAFVSKGDPPERLLEALRDVARAAPDLL